MTSGNVGRDFKTLKSLVTTFKQNNVSRVYFGSHVECFVFRDIFATGCSTYSRLNVGQVLHNFYVILVAKRRATQRMLGPQMLARYSNMNYCLPVSSDSGTMSNRFLHYDQVNLADDLATTLPTRERRASGTLTEI